MKLARVLSALGRTLITAGVLILLFVAYQLWGTNIHTARAQNRLEEVFAAGLEEAAASTPTTASTTAPPGPTTTETLPVSTVPPLASDVIPPEGEAAGRIEIPAIGADWVFVSGVSVPNLKKGPGHYPDTPLPGQSGNAAIAGHRTTYGAPFRRVNELAIGDEIWITTVQGRFRYLVRDVDGDGNGFQLVAPSAVEVLDDFGDNRLTLTSCHPKFSARERIIIVADLVGSPAPTPVDEPPPGQGDGSNAGDSNGGDSNGGAPSIDPAGLSGESASIWAAVLLGLLCAAIWLAAWLVGRRWRPWPAYLIALPFFLVALFFFFESFSSLLPANY